MELNILSKEEKPLLSRTEIIAEIIFDAATPKKEEIKKKTATILKSDPNLVVVKKVYNMFGKKQAKVLAFIYTNEKDMKRIEPKPKVKKEKKEEEVPAEAPKKEEAPKEEKKEPVKPSNESEKGLEKSKTSQKEKPKEDKKEG